MKETLTPGKFIKVHGPAVSVMTSHRGNSHFVSSKHKTGHHYSVTVDSQEHAEHLARQLSGKEKNDYKDKGADGTPLETHSRNFKNKGQKGAESEEQGYAMPEIERQG